ncbi:hypothetical protein JG677_01770 [Campylobacter sp. TTU-622]|uniref:hypothetical protein n=1 Tax=unclassified Campylobacter TaxID=2593542 RepID=UPI0019048077|nr:MULTISPECIES: hypothetical protein [unclassified Campylobacter]MBK1971732.1 hypothetical protein [Campylobacter sp. TTU_617]MBK1972793.1 hypothetical protein [Campylobacter sp. TTU-622]MBK1991680.1 hypothetical protein [Campylobacter sp. 2018MI34]
MKTWLDKFKLALIEENISILEELVDNFPRNMDNEKLIEVKALTEEAIRLIISKKDIAAKEIHKFKRALEYTKA